MKKLSTNLILLFTCLSCNFLNAQRVTDQLDSFKLSGPSYIKEVKICRVQDSIEIYALDASFIIKPGMNYEPKKFTPGWVNPTREFTKSVIYSQGTKVRIKYKNLKKDLYGVLEFNHVYKECSGDPSARSYYITLTDKAVQRAMGGNTTVAYEHYECAPRSGVKSANDYTTKKQKYTSYVLWISDVPFE